MYVRIVPSGTVSFRLDYQLNGRRETVYLGSIWESTDVMAFRSRMLANYA